MWIKNTLFFILLFFVSTLYSKASVEDDFKAANTFYSEQKYEEAIAKYNAVLDKNYVADDLYYNLGNTYFKTNQLALAILNYEKAIKLNPTHEDALFNLKVANARTIDKVERLPSMFIGNAWQNLVTSKTVTNWSYLSVFLIFVALVLFISYLLIRIIVVKKVGFYGGCFFLLLSLFSWFMAAQHTSYLKTKTEAIVFSTVVDVVSEPNNNGKKLFTLHEGIKVDLIENTLDWSKIKIPNGNVGWVKNEVLQEI